MNLADMLAVAVYFDLGAVLLMFGVLIGEGLERGRAARRPKCATERDRLAWNMGAWLQVAQKQSNTVAEQKIRQQAAKPSDYMTIVVLVNCEDFDGER